MLLRSPLHVNDWLIRISQHLSHKSAIQYIVHVSMIMYNAHLKFAALYWIACRLKLWCYILNQIERGNDLDFACRSKSSLKIWKLLNLKVMTELTVCVMTDKVKSSKYCTWYPHCPFGELNKFLELGVHAQVHQHPYLLSFSTYFLGVHTHWWRGNWLSPLFKVWLEK